MTMSDPSPEDLVQQIATHTGAKKSGGGYIGKCPAHADKNSSLSIAVGNTGKVLLKCHAGCPYELIVAALPEHLRGKKREEKKHISERKREGVQRVKEVAVYTYCDEDGVEKFQAVRLEPKSFRIRYRDESQASGYRYRKPEDCEYLYRLPHVRKECEKGGEIWVCEGEKDVETLVRLGVCATTNVGGATNFPAVLLNQLRGASRIVLCEDNDLAGRKRVEQLYMMLTSVAKVQKSSAEIFVLRCRELPEHSDVTDLVESGISIVNLRARCEKIESEKQVALTPAEVVAVDVAEKEEAKTAKGSDKRDAMRVDYIRLVESRYGKLRCEKLTEEIVVKNELGLFFPIDNKKEVLESMAREATSSGMIKYKTTAVLPAIKDYAETLERELLIDIPAWDGRDRIAEIFEVVQFEGLESRESEELFKQWGAGIFERLEDPTIQPITPIIIGAQGVGKDTLVDALCRGFGMYFSDLQVSKFGLEEAKKDIHTKLVWNISEFDRTAKAEIAALKWMLSTHSARSRLSYDRRAEDRTVRCSFIASCNVENVIADSTGARRFWVLKMSYGGFKMREREEVVGMVGTAEVEKIYPGHFRASDMAADRAQIVAQFRALAREKFRAGKTAIDKMASAVDRLSPESYEDLVVQEWLEAVPTITAEPFFRKTFWGAAAWRVGDVDDILGRIAKSQEINKRSVQRILKQRGFFQMSEGTRLYAAFSVSSVKELKAWEVSKLDPISALKGHQNDEELEPLI